MISLLDHRVLPCVGVSDSLFDSGSVPPRARRASSIWRIS